MEEGCPISEPTRKRRTKRGTAWKDYCNNFSSILNDPSFVTGYDDVDNENQDLSESDCEVFEMNTSDNNWKHLFEFSWEEYDSSESDWTP